MKYTIAIFTVSIGLFFTACGSNSDEHSHGDEADHTHEQPAQQTDQENAHTHNGEEPHTHDSESDDTQAHEPEETRHSHEEESDHQHGEETDENHSHDDEQAHEHQTPEKVGSGSVTKWTDETELFMEYPEIIVGEEATFAVHLTRLSDFRALDESEVQFNFEPENGNRISVTETEVQIPGIYGPDVTFEQAGRYDLTIIIQGMVNDTMRVYGIPVYNSLDEIPPYGEEEDPNLVSFLKEQQWKIPFATSTVSRRTLAQTVEAHGEVMPANSREAVVSAPFSGIILNSMNRNLPVAGQQVSRGTALLSLNPTIQSVDGENYVQQFINARSKLELAKTNLDRSERLYQREAIPEVELERARIEYRQAATRFQTINEIARIDTSAVDSYGNSQESYRFELTSPISGTILEMYATPGMQVRAGEPLFRVADMSKVWLQVRVPASERRSLGTPESAVFSVQGEDQSYVLEETNGRLVSMGNNVDPQTRTLSLIYEVDNPDLALQNGLFTTVEIDAQTKENVLAIPETALIEEEGNFAVYVHVSGEAFEKRSITIGIRNRGWVEVTSGLSEGEHVVTKNAYQVKLASLSSEAPAHGHSH